MNPLLLLTFLGILCDAKESHALHPSIALLNSLGIKARPRLNSSKSLISTRNSQYPMPIPQFMIDLYQTQIMANLESIAAQEGEEEEGESSHFTRNSLVPVPPASHSHRRQQGIGTHSTPTKPVRQTLIGPVSTTISHPQTDPDRLNSWKRIPEAKRIITPEDEMLIAFNVSLPEKELLSGAELRIPYRLIYDRQTNVKDGTPSDKISSQRKTLGQVQVNEVLKQARLNGDLITRTIDLFSITYPPRFPPSHSVDEIHWISLDILPSVARWVDDPSQNYGLLVKFVQPKTKRADSVKLYLKDGPMSPQLITYSRDEAQTDEKKILSRMKRRAAISGGSGRGRGRTGHRGKHQKRNLCRRHRLYVNFSNVGWNDWIVAPSGYEAYYCAGECPYPVAGHLNTTNHAIVQTLVNSVSHMAVPRACCVPTHLRSVSMLYVDEDDKVVLKSYQDMVVEGCGCR